MTHAQIEHEPTIASSFHDWRDSAPCGKEDPEMFFDNAELDEGVAAQAKAICAGCQLREKCLNQAMLSSEEYGIWGGMDPMERHIYRSLWQRLNGGRAAVRTMREKSGMLVHDPSIDRRYTARLKAAQECRKAILAADNFHRRDEYLAVLEMIIAYPTEDAGTLGRRCGFSKTWFNMMKRDVYNRFGISEVYEGVSA